MARVSARLINRLAKLQTKAKAGVSVAYFPPMLNADEWECVAIKQQHDLMQWVVEEHN